MAIIQPTNLEAQVALENMPKTRLIHRIIIDFPASYILCLMNSPRFTRCNFGDGSGASRRAGLEDLEHWAEKDLTDLRTTLCARNPSDVKASVPTASLESSAGTMDTLSLISSTIRIRTIPSSWET